jgi:hypothetical protein
MATWSAAQVTSAARSTGILVRGLENCAALDTPAADPVCLTWEYSTYTPPPGQPYRGHEPFSALMTMSDGGMQSDPGMAALFSEPGGACETCAPRPTGNKTIEITSKCYASPTFAREQCTESTAAQKLDPPFPGLGPCTGWAQAVAESVTALAADAYCGNVIPTGAMAYVLLQDAATVTPGFYHVPRQVGANVPTLPPFIVAEVPAPRTTGTPRIACGAPTDMGQNGCTYQPGVPNAAGVSSVGVKNGLSWLPFKPTVPIDDGGGVDMTNYSAAAPFDGETFWAGYVDLMTSGKIPVTDPVKNGNQVEVQYNSADIRSLAFLRNVTNQDGTIAAPNAANAASACNMQAMLAANKDPAYMSGTVPVVSMDLDFTSTTGGLVFTDYTCPSLRVLDWLVTNYSKAHLIQCTGPDGFPRDLHNAYRETLGFYSRPLFDPFSRGERTRVTYELEGETLNSSIAQLSFMRFVLQANDMLQYAISNAPAIEADMAGAQARARELRGAGTGKRRVELTAYNPTRVHVMRLPAHAAAEPAEEGV